MDTTRNSRFPTWTAVADREPFGTNEIEHNAGAKQVKVVFTYEGTAYLGIGLFTVWETGKKQWAELDDDKDHFTEMRHGVPDFYIILPEIP